MPRLAATPSTEEILRWILQAISSNINSLQSLRMPVCCRSLLMYGKVACAHGLASNDEEAPLWPCYELSKDVLNEGSAQELLVMLLERLNDASDVLKTIEEQLQGLVLRYCDAMTLLPNTDDPLEDLASQMEWSKGGKPPVDLGFNFNSKLTKEEYIRKVTQSAAGRAAWTAWGEEVARIADVGAK
eukprot:symbB.v1.2.017039.t1/scaffold1317.1/size125501/6